MAEDLLRNTENFNIAFGNVVHMNYANNSEESSEYNMTIQRDNISKHNVICCPSNKIFIKVNMQMTIWVGVQDQWLPRAACNVICCLSKKLRSTMIIANSYLFNLHNLLS